MYHWVVRGGPTTLEQLKEQVVVDPLTLREYRMGPLEKLSAEQVETIRGELRKTLEAEIEPAKLLDLAEQAEDSEKEFVLVRSSAERYAALETPTLR